MWLGIVGNRPRPPLKDTFGLESSQLAEKLARDLPKDHCFRRRHRKLIEQLDGFRLLDWFIRIQGVNIHVGINGVHEAHRALGGDPSHAGSFGKSTT